MLTMFKIEKEDIKTSKIGINIMISIDDKTGIIFSKEALDELFKDYYEIKKIDEIPSNKATSFEDLL